ncbi:MAG: selenide, water dikinase SelD [Saprospiraceae bacterium]|jgi:selenide,water dikinase|nr:selenide, water dikinase SelD [Saprospiraceae bacterium]
MSVKLTQYSHGAGCGCKIAPNILEQILQSNLAYPTPDQLIVGNHSKDDAAVYNLGNGSALISTTDFFMPIVDDPYDFGRIASANAISDVYAMGGYPVLAIAILGWPLDKLSPDIARSVIEGSRAICAEAGIALAGGHSIDAPEPIFGLAVNGLVEIPNIKQNNTARPGDYLFLTKPLGVGIFTTAEKKGILTEEHRQLATAQMMQLNKVGKHLGACQGVHAMTDVTGFGLLGHLSEICSGSDVSATIEVSKVPLIHDDLVHYLAQKAIPGGTIRNLKAYGHHIDTGQHADTENVLHLLADPQTSGGLLISVGEDSLDEVKSILSDNQLDRFVEPIGRIQQKQDHLIYLH